MDFKQEYIEEVKQILKNLENSVMVVDKDPDNPGEIDNIYRYLHTVKGSASMFDFNEMERLTHELENIYSDVREGARIIDEYVLDITLHAIDVLNDLIDGSEDYGPSRKIIDSIVSLRGITGDAGGADAPSGAGKITEAFTIFFTPNENIFKRGVNVSALLEDLEELKAHEIIIHNETIPFEKQLTEKNFISWLEILVLTDGGEESIKDIFIFLNDNEYKIVKISAVEDLTAPSYAAQLQLTEEQIRSRIEIFESFEQTIFNSNDEEKRVENRENALNELKELADVEIDLDQALKNAATEKRDTKKNSYINVSTDKLDGLINIVSELVTFRSEMQHLLSDEKNIQIIEAVEKLEFLTLRLRDSAFNIRLVPINILNVKIQRLIRSLSKELGKEVNFITEGLDTELDRSIISALEAPLMHIIRNSLDHGIEAPDEREAMNKPRKGLLKLYSYNSGDHVFIQIQDDGKGIDFKKIREKAIVKGLLNANDEHTEKELIQVMMSPGFSTTETVTKISGRGVGMDVVKKEINAMRGDIDISTEEGLGTIITLRLPLTLTILDTLVVKVSAEKYLIPINEIEYCYEQGHDELFKNKRRVVSHNDTYIPMISLREFFGSPQFPDSETVIVINKNDTRVAVVVDEILGQYQTVYKPLNELLQPIDFFSGASILGDGSTALILNALKLMN